MYFMQVSEGFPTLDLMPERLNKRKIISETTSDI